MLLEKSIPISYIFKKIRKDFFLVVLLVVLIIVSKYFTDIEFNLPVSIPAFLGTAISLVLAFKLSQSYDRWWESRKIWGSIVNDSRTLVIQLKTFCLNSESNTRAIEKIGLRQIAFSYSLSNLLRKTKSVPCVEDFMDSKDVEKIVTHTNIPLKIIDLNAEDIGLLRESNQINDFQQIQLDDTLVRICASMGKAERIKNTIFPKTYRLFLRFFIFVFVVTLAISLSDLHPAFEFPLLLAISLPFFLLKKTAHHMQDPFENRPTDTAMDSISNTIEINIKQLLNMKDVPNPKLPDEEYYIM